MLDAAEVPAAVQWHQTTTIGLRSAGNLALQDIAQQLLHELGSGREGGYDGNAMRILKIEMPLTASPKAPRENHDERLLACSRAK